MSATSFSPSSAAGHSYHLSSHLLTEEKLEDTIRSGLYEQLKGYIPDQHSLKNVLNELILKHQKQLCEPGSITTDGQLKSVELLSSILCYAIIYKEREIVDLLMPMDHMLSHFFAFLPKISADQRTDILTSAADLGYQKITNGLINTPKPESPPKSIFDMTVEEISDVLVLAIRRKDLVTAKGFFLMLDKNKLSHILVYTIKNKDPATINALFLLLDNDTLSHVLAHAINIDKAADVRTFINTEMDRYKLIDVLARAINVGNIDDVKTIVSQFDEINYRLLSDVLVTFCEGNNIDTARELINILVDVPHGISELLYNSLCNLINGEEEKTLQQLISVMSFRKLYKVLNEAYSEGALSHLVKLIGLSNADQLYKVLELARQQDPRFRASLVNKMTVETLDAVLEHAKVDNNEGMQQQLNDALELQIARSRK